MLPQPSEARTRKELIDPALKRAGWDVADANRVGLEIPVDGFDPTAWQKLQQQLTQIRASGGVVYNLETPKGVSDYVLYRPNGEIIGVVEAKRTSTDPRLAQTQAEFYVSEIAKRQSFRPFAFMTNGESIYFLDAGQAAKREVQGFFSPDDLENQLFLRENRLPFAAVPINTQITDRAYQQEAIRRVCEAFERGKRRALIVMATGTGKTRVAMSLIDVMLRANQARRILFVADRDPLVQQALTDGFKKFLPDEPCARIHSYNIEKTLRLYVATLQTLSNCFQDFTPGFFDAIFFDEVHRSIFNKWNEVLLYFDARMIGLTATPAEFLDRNTFREFACDGNRPTYLYSYPQAVDDKYLVDFDLYSAKTRFQRKGIRGVDLTEEERNILIDQGLDPDALDYAGTEIERTVSNLDTLRKQWEEIWEQCIKDRSGQLPGKTIVFAMTQEHALRLADAYEAMFPQFPDLVRVITYKSDFKGALIEKFKKADQPRIAITVDLLETGIDVPEAVNLVFMRPVHSAIKLWQMIGRGTRSQAACTYPNRLPDGGKQRFLILDFWENDFNRAPDPEQAQSLPVLVSLFNTRLALMERTLDDQSSPEALRTIADLRGMVARIPTDSLLVKRVYPEIEAAWRDSWWFYLNASKLEFLLLKVGPLLRYASDVDVEAATFTHKVERLKLSILESEDLTGFRKPVRFDLVASIAEDVSRLPDYVFENPCSRELARLCLTPQMQTATASQLSAVIDALAGEMRNRRARENAFVKLDLPDYVEMRGYILLMGGTERLYVEEYRRRVEQRILDLVDTHPTLQAIGRGEPVSDLALIELERALHQDLGGPGLEFSEENIRKAYGMKVGSLLEFLRRLLELDGLPDYGDIVQRQFSDYIAAHPFNADQIRFLRAVQNVFLQKRRLQPADFYDPPLTAFGQDAVDRWFAPEQVSEMLALTERLV
jgi:type I restriction enzyme R subunit